MSSSVLRFNNLHMSTELMRASAAFVYGSGDNVGLRYQSTVISP